MKSKNFISILIITFFIFLALIYVNNNLPDFIEIISRITISSLWKIFLIAILIFIFLLTSATLFKALLQPFKIPLSNKEAFGLSVVTRFYNLITPFRGGAAARAIYLKKKHDFPYVHFLATLSAIYILIFLVSSITGIFSMLILPEKNNLILLALSLFAIFLLAITIFSPKIKERKNKWLDRIIKVVNGWNLIKNNKRIITITLIISILQIFLSAINNLIAYQIFGITISIPAALFISAISSLSIIIAITPGNLGIGDAINVFTANLIGIPMTEAIAATILLRAVNLVIIFILGPIFSYKLIKKK
jgi:uncharacterized protein (TIRG00374 family)